MRIRDMAYVSIFVALIVICSWLTIPAAVPFTMQTFAIFLAVELLGGKRGSLAVLIYILLGAIGLPVFSGFSGGLGAILGTTGGYIIGFLVAAIVAGALERFIKGGTWRAGLRMLIGLISCYAIGTVWFMWLYSEANGAVSLMTVLSWCVIPFIIPDVLKICLAVFIAGRLRKHLPK